MKSRKRKAGRREPNGRLSRRQADTQARRGETEAETLSTALEARARLYGLPEQHLRDERAGTVVGRLALSGELTTLQHRAAVKWCEVRSRFQRAILSRGEGQGGGSRGSPEFVSDEYVEWCKKSIEQYDEASMVLIDLSVSVRSQNISAAVTLMVERDMYVPELLRDLDLALNALAKHWGLDAGRSEKAA